MGLTASFVGAIAVGNLLFKGLRIRITTDDAPGSISSFVDQDACLDTIDPVPVSRQRLSAKSAAVTPGELTLYRHAVGALFPPKKSDPPTDEVGVGSVVTVGGVALCKA